jgi:hypothetical protein
METGYTNELQFDLQQNWFKRWPELSPVQELYQFDQTESGDIRANPTLETVVFDGSIYKYEKASISRHMDNGSLSSLSRDYGDITTVTTLHVCPSVKLYAFLVWDIVDADPLPIFRSTCLSLSQRLVLQAAKCTEK